MSKERFDVSTIIPVYNGAQFLVKAIENVQKQNYQSLEIIVADDGSTDGTAEIAKQFGDSIKYIYQQNAGPSAARNRGIKMARGNVIAFLDVDDCWSDHKLKLQLDCLANHPQVGIVQGLIQQMRQHENDLMFEELYEPYQFINLGSAIYRSSVFEKVGLFDENLMVSEDTDWFIRAWEHNVIKIVLQEVTLFYYQHKGNMSRDHSRIHFGLTRLFKKHLDRGRRKDDNILTPSVNFANIAEYIGRVPTKSIALITSL